MPPLPGGGVGDIGIANTANGSVQKSSVWFREGNLASAASRAMAGFNRKPAGKGCGVDS